MTMRLHNVTRDCCSRLYDDDGDDDDDDDDNDDDDDDVWELYHLLFQWGSNILHLWSIGRCITCIMSRDP